MIERDLEEQTLATVARIVTLLEGRGLRCALVGAAALAVHGYSRATEDVDLGIATGDLLGLRTLADELRSALGVDVALALPDADDPLGGVVTITGPAISQVQIVNFLNPIGIGHHPGREGVLQASSVRVGGADVNVVDLPHLVAMKLAAGGMKSRADVVELLHYNPTADLAAIGALCARFALEPAWLALLPEITSRRS